MKPCRKNRKPIACLALNALEPQAARALREHLHHCDGCRSYLAEISHVTATLASAGAAPQAGVEPSPAFHASIARALRQSPAAGARVNWQDLGSNLLAILSQRRVAWPAFGVVALVILLVLVFPSRPHRTVPARPEIAALPRGDREPKADLAPTISNYELVAGKSLEQLDDLLTRQSLRNPPPLPRFSILTLTDSSD